MHYAVIDKDGYIIGIRHLSGKVIKENLIEIEQDFDQTNKKWNGSSWENYVPPEPPEPQPSQLDRIEALAVAGKDIEEKTLGEVTNLGESNLIIMEAIATQYEEGIENDLNNKEVLATIYEEILAQKEVK